VSIGMPA